MTNTSFIGKNAAELDLPDVDSMVEPEEEIDHDLDHDIGPDDDLTDADIDALADANPYAHTRHIDIDPLDPHAVGKGIKTAWDDHNWLWIPRWVATGKTEINGTTLKLTGTHILVYITLLARSSNTTRRLTVNTRLVALRCGVTTETVRLAIKHLASVDLLSIEQSGPGKPLKIKVVAGTARSCLKIPEAVFWNHSYPNPPSLNGQHDSETVRSLLCLIRRFPHPKKEIPNVTMTCTATYIVAGTTLSKTGYKDGLAAWVGPGVRPGETRIKFRATPGGWFSTKSSYRTDLDTEGRSPLQAPSTYCLDWTRLAPCVAVAGISVPYTDDYDQDTDIPATEARISRLPKHDNPGHQSTTIPASTTTASCFSGAEGTNSESSGAPSSSSRHPVPTKRLTLVKTEEEGPRPKLNTNATVGDIKLALRVTTGARQTTDKLLRGMLDAVASPTELTDDEWSAVVLANLAHAAGHHRWAFAASELSRAKVAVLAARHDGDQSWHPTALASQLLNEPTTGVKSLVAVLTTRLNRMVEVPTESTAPAGADGPWAAARVVALAAPRSRRLIDDPSMTY